MVSTATSKRSWNISTLVTVLKTMTLLSRPTSINLMSTSMLTSLNTETKSQSSQAGKPCRNIMCPRKNPQPLRNFAWASNSRPMIHGRKKYRRNICRRCYNARSAPAKRIARQRRREALRLAEIMLSQAEMGFTPRHLRKAPEEVPEGQKWCWFCEEFHDLDYFTGSSCREYACWKMYTWRQDPNNTERQRKYWRRYSFKRSLRRQIEASGCNVLFMQYENGTLLITISPKYWKKRLLKKL